MKLMNYRLLHNDLTKLVFFEKVVQLRKNIHSSTFNLASSTLNFLFSKAVILLYAVTMSIDSLCSDKLKLIFSKIQDKYSNFVNRSVSVI